MTTPHKHAQLIHAWADGAKIEFKNNAGVWITAKIPIWYEDYEYRIKPIPKPDLVCYGAFSSPDNPNADRTLFVYDGIPLGFSGYNKIKMTFDGETKKLKSVEILE